MGMRQLVSTDYIYADEKLTYCSVESNEDELESRLKEYVNTELFRLFGAEVSIFRDPLLIPMFMLILLSSLSSIPFSENVREPPMKTTATSMFMYKQVKTLLL